MARGDFPGIWLRPIEAPLALIADCGSVAKRI
jgi:hypothetical protein